MKKTAVSETLYCVNFGSGCAQLLELLVLMEVYMVMVDETRNIGVLQYRWKW